jgi:hypothetical protein
MPTDLEIAYRCAPVIVQKVSPDNPRGDFITRVDFTDPVNLASLTNNWAAVNDPVKNQNDWKKIPGDPSFRFTYKLLPHVYYSVVETHSHYFVLYAIYHPQDWESGDTALHHKPRWKSMGSEHEHDMEGALVIASKRGDFKDLRPDAMITISHWWFYSYANWRLRKSNNKEEFVFTEKTENRYCGSRVNKETLDGNLWAVWHIDEDRNETLRPKLYIQAKGHGIRGDKKGWGGEKRQIRYCPSMKRADEPSFAGSGMLNPNATLLQKNKRTDATGWSPTEVYRYKLVDIFERNTARFPAKGLWENRNNSNVFSVDGKGQDCFIVHKSSGNKLEPGPAKPPWSWDDRDDARPTGELALQPAHIVYGYLGGIREFSLEYLRNPYLGI